RIFVITHHGNLILNIQKETFIQAVQSSNFQIEIRTQAITNLSRKYHSNHRNNIGAIFNDTGYLEIFMVGGNLAQIFHFDKYSNNKITIKIGHDSRSQINF
ncbi:MAG: SAM hydroxide adenosyltransferase, partial [Chitinophagales bacterium]